MRFSARQTRGFEVKVADFSSSVCVNESVPTVGEAKRSPYHKHQVAGDSTAKPRALLFKLSDNL